MAHSVRDPCIGRKKTACEIRALCGRAGYFRQACRRGETRHFNTELQAGKCVHYTEDIDLISDLLFFNTAGKKSLIYRLKHELNQ